MGRSSLIVALCLVLTSCAALDPSVRQGDGKWHAPSATKAAIGLGAVAVLLVGFDVWLATRNPPDATISRSIADWSLDHPIVPFAVGVVLGHIFWPQPYTPRGSE